MRFKPTSPQSSWFLAALSLALCPSGGIFASPGSTGRPVWLGDARCAKAVFDQLPRWGVLGEWRRAVDPDGVRQIYRSPTRELGTWVEARVSGTGEVELRRIMLGETATLHWDPRKCAPHLETQEDPVDMSRIRDGFNDEALASLMTSQSSGVIYAWSPHMEYSLSGISRIRAAGAKLRVPIYLVVDPQAEPGLVQRAVETHKLKAADSKRIQALELLYRDMLNHFPSFVMFHRGKIGSATFFGLKSEADYAKIIAKSLE